MVHIVFCDVSLICDDYCLVQVVNLGTNTVNLKVSVKGLEPNSISPSGSTKTVLTSNNLMDENSFSEPKKVTESTLYR